MTKQFIWVTLRVEFIHQYKDAPEEVSFLRYPHRHIAHIKVKVEVSHDDREIEFIIFKRELETAINLSELTNRSCENIARSILLYIQDHYGSNREITVEVAEDGENGCELIYIPTLTIT